MKFTGRMAIDAYVEFLEAETGERPTEIRAQQIAKENGLLVHANRRGFMFVSTPEFERQHPLRPQH